MKLPWGEGDRVAIVAAHPDDEVIGMGAQLPGLRNPLIVHATDGAPSNLQDAIRSGFSSAREYAEARARELACALALGGIGAGQCRSLDIPDQEASLNLVSISLLLVELLGDVDVVVTHPYEGGHPDHDATCFAVHAACRKLGKPVAEFTSYHERDGKFVTGEFPESGEQAVVVLDPAGRDLKERMFACFATQQGMLAAFSLESEKFRHAPRYCFTEVPNGGRVWYDRHGWNMRSERWIVLAGEAERMLAVQEWG